MREARSFEQDLLWSVLDQDAVPQILSMAKSHWGMDISAGWTELQRQAELGHLRAYRSAEYAAYVDLGQLSIDEATRDFNLFVEPTESTRTRLREIEEGAGN